MKCIILTMHGFSISRVYPVIWHTLLLFQISVLSKYDFSAGVAFLAVPLWSFLGEAVFDIIALVLLRGGLLEVARQPAGFVDAVFLKKGTFSIRKVDLF